MTRVELGMAVHTTHEQLRGDSRVLVLAPVQGHEGLCGSVLTSGQAATRRVLLVTDRWAPSEVVADWRHHHGTLPASLALVCPGRPDPDTADLPASVHATGVPADDLTGVSLAVSRYLDRWGRNASVGVCVDSLEGMLSGLSRDEEFRLLHTLTDRFLAADATAHVHVDPARRDERTVESLRSLFDTVVRPDGENWTVD